MKVCNHCGAQLPDNATVCFRCKATLGAPAAPQQYQQPAPQGYQQPAQGYASPAQNWQPQGGYQPNNGGYGGGIY